MSVQPFLPPGVLTANALAGQTVPGALGVSGVFTAGALSGAVPELQAATPLAGVALINGTQNIVTWTAPNDGALHRFALYVTQDVTLLETGGLVSITFTSPDGTVSPAHTVFPGGSAAGETQPSASYLKMVRANTAVTLAQSSALTAGAAIVWAEIWGS